MRAGRVLRASSGKLPHLMLGNKYVTIALGVGIFAVFIWGFSLGGRVNESEWLRKEAEAAQAREEARAEIDRLSQRLAEAQARLEQSIPDTDKARAALEAVPSHPACVIDGPVTDSLRDAFGQD